MTLLSTVPKPGGPQKQHPKQAAHTAKPSDKVSARSAPGTDEPMDWAPGAGKTRGLRVVVRLDPDLDLATVVVDGALTTVNCGALLGIVDRAHCLASQLRVRVELRQPEAADPSALARLYGCASCIIAQGPVNVRPGPGIGTP